MEIVTVANNTIKRPLRVKVLVALVLVLLIVVAGLASYILFWKKDTKTTTTKPEVITNYVAKPVTETKTVILRQGAGAKIEAADGRFVDLVYRVADAKDGKIVDKTHNSSAQSLKIQLNVLPKIIQDSIVGQNIDTSIRILIKQQDTDSIKSIIGSSPVFTDGAIIDMRIIAVATK